MIKGQLGPTVKAQFLMNDKFKYALNIKHAIDLICAMCNSCYNLMMGSEPVMESVRELETLLNFKQKGELAPFAKKLSSRHKDIAKRLGNCYAGKNLMKKVITNKHPRFTIRDYNNVNNYVVLSSKGKNGNDLTVPVTMMTMAQKEECNKACHEIMAS